MCGDHYQVSANLYRGNRHLGWGLHSEVCQEKVCRCTGVQPVKYSVLEAGGTRYSLA